MKKEKIISLLLLGILFLIPFVLCLEDPNVLSGSMGFSVIVKGGMICENGKTQWVDYNTDPPGFNKRDSFGEDGNCYYEGGMAENGEIDSTCCPNYYTCTYDGTPDIFWGTEFYKCKLDTRNSCELFNKSESDCTEDGNGNSDVAWNTIDSLSGQTCGADPLSWTESDGVNCENFTHCKCVWDAAKGKCNALQNITTDCYDEEGPTTTDSNGNCSWEINYDQSVDHCNDGGGYILNIWDGTWNPARVGEDDPSCIFGVEQRVDCSSIIMMGFFDENMFIISVFLILIIYLLQLIINKTK